MLDSARIAAAVTRARLQVVIVGDPALLRSAVQIPSRGQRRDVRFWL